ncbi:MAG: alpha/beta hydrolase [Lachnospiraceae bacterium]|nr:alpha/beta hydrolase [Lachnospiraceae bacterium]
MRFQKTDVRLPIWGKTIPGNTGKSKRDIMDWKENETMEYCFAVPGIWDKSTHELGDLSGNDTMVYLDEMKNGYAKETYSDVPFLVPFLVPGSDKCVISCPGGAYLTKSVDNEGEDVAAFLNKAGISCFVLWYRSYPYHAPLMYLDLQRAVRYVRFHAAEYGVDPQKIGTVGFSAGGNLNSVAALCLGNAPVAYEGYEPDEIDGTDASVNALGLIYPALTMYDDKIVACIAGKDVYNDTARCNAFAAQYDVLKKVKEGSAPMFLCACMDDDVLPALRLSELAAACREKNVSCELHIFPYGGHGFGGCESHPNPFGEPDFSAVRAWKDLFAAWVNRVM